MLPYTNDRVLSDEENLGLPFPRLEIRYEHDKLCAYYNLVKRGLSGPLFVVYMGHFYIGPIRTDFNPDFKRLFEDTLINDMIELDLPGYIVHGTEFTEVNEEYFIKTGRPELINLFRK